MSIRRRQTGMTLIELIIFIVIVGVGLAGIQSVLNVTTQSSADPMIRKNMLAIAESLLEEVQLQSFTWCDPDDPTAATATSYLACTTVQNTVAGKAGEVRGSSTSPLDNILDYNGLDDITSNTSQSSGQKMPLGYSASIGVAAVDLKDIAKATGAALLITVVVCRASTCNQSSTGNVIMLQGYRTRYAPNSMP